MSSSTRSPIETKIAISNSEVRLKIPKLIQKPLKEQTDHRDVGNSESSAMLKVVSTSWRDNKRLYPPFQRRMKDVFAQKDEGNQEKIAKSVPELKKFRLSVCMRKKQFPIDVPFVCNGKSLEFGGSDSLYLSSGCGGYNEIPSICGLHHAPCIGPICGQDNEPCNITRGADRVDDVCQDAISTHDDKSDEVSVSADKPVSHCCMTACGESIDYAICESTETTASTAIKDDALRRDLGGEDYFDIHNEEHESFSFISEYKSKSEMARVSELFQDPLVSHRLTISYNKMPPSRYRVGGSLNDSSRTKSLANRPRSPIRDIPEGRFDVYAGISEVMRRAEIHNAKYAVRKSKECMAEIITSDSMSSSTSATSAELLKTFLKVLLDDVRLSLTIGESENDLSLTLATIWDITEFVMTEVGLEVTQSATIAHLGAVSKFKRSLSHNMRLLGATPFQRTSDISYTPRNSDNQFLHRALPWVHLCAAHAQGLPNSYVTVRTRIDEVTPNNGLERPRVAYLPDISCAHLQKMSPNKPVTLKNKSEDLEEENL